MDAGPERIDDETIVRLLRARARKVYVESIAFGLALTALCLLLPF